MEKSARQALVLQKKGALKTRLLNSTGTLHKHLFVKSSLLKFFVVVQALLAPNGDHYTRRYITWLSLFDFESSLRYEKVISKMGISFAHN